MAATSSTFQEDGTTELVFADGQVTRVPSAIVYDRLGDPLPVPSVFKNIAAVSVTAGTPVSIWTPAAGKRFRLLGWALANDALADLKLEDGTGNEVLRVPNAAAVSPSLGLGYLSAAVNNHLFVDVTTTGHVSGFVFGTEE